MIKHPMFRVEPWCLREVALDLDMLAQAESVFALSNGHIGWRGNLDEGEPHGLPGSYLNGVYENRPLPAAEAAYGLPQSVQTVVNVTNGKMIRLFVDDEPFDVRYGTLRAHERVLDFRAGVLRRTAEWVSPAGGAVRVSSVRLVSFTQRAIAAIRYEVEPLDGPVRIAVQSELLANEQLPSGTGDPRHGADLGRPLAPESKSSRDRAVILMHSTKNSGLRIASAMDHLIDGPDPHIETHVFDDGGAVTAAALVAPGQRLTMVKYVGYGWSGVRSLVGDQAVPARLPGAAQRRPHLVPDRGQGPGARPAVRDELDQLQPLPRPHEGGHRGHAAVGKHPGFNVHVGPVDLVIHRGADPQLAELGLVHQERGRPLPALVLLLQRVVQDGAEPGIADDDGQLLVREQFGLQRDPRRVLQRLHLVADRTDRTLGERHQPGGRHPDHSPGR